MIVQNMLMLDLFARKLKTGNLMQALLLLHFMMYIQCIYPTSWHMCLDVLIRQAARNLKYVLCLHVTQIRFMHSTHSNLISQLLLIGQMRSKVLYIKSFVRYKCNSKHKRIMQSTIDIQESRTEDQSHKQKDSGFSVGSGYKLWINIVLTDIYFFLQTCMCQQFYHTLKGLFGCPGSMSC